MSTKYPQYVDYHYPISDPTARPGAPLVRVATDHDLRATTLRDPVTGRVVTCEQLVSLDRECWRDVDARFPARYAYRRTPAQRQLAMAAVGTCRRRAAPLLQTCKVPGVRAG